ncbi:putative beta transducin-like protein [Fusarium austroafricanum]|uniref:Putative beta transducin-like protein n=1 Tax=Fusarium austroafricanum TaxID=2364996 RepID=A0A8H4P344_9HYPO|nr:putative beta transducin-like protein [Fusarium austroafricanum]
MRLLNARSLRLENFTGAEIETPLYAILSHTWGNDEITFQDITQLPLNDLRRRHSFSKILECCMQARRDGYDYVWIDTCCIDKSSSSELSEAINSMFKWYQQTALCYVYLHDFDSSISYNPVNTHQGKEVRLDATDISFFASRWFTRGWTLQELIAPRNVDFFDRNWVRFGSRDIHLLDRICQRTGIWPQLFEEARCSCPRGYPSPPVRDGVCTDCQRLDTLPQTLDSFAVSIKMSWASSRITTRKEDAAYCLLGLFNLNLPMLYGEGHKAFLRLQEAIVRQSKDQSLLLWRAGPSDLSQELAPGCLAPSSGLFKEPVRILGRRVFNRVDRRYEADFLGSMAPMEITDTAIRTSLWICPCTVGAYEPHIGGYNDRKLWLGILELAYDDDYLVRPAVLLEYMGAADLYRRIYHQLIIPIDPRQVHGTLQVSLTQNRPGAIPQGNLDTSKIAITWSINEASKNNANILLQQSPINAVTTNPSLEEGPETGPVYFVVTARKVECKMDSGGSHPPFSRYAARAPLIPARWAFKKCHHPGIERYFGGIHFVNFEVPAASKLYFYSNPSGQGLTTRGYVAIIWGVHRELAEEGSSESQSPWRLWCRAFNMYDFIKYTRTSTEDLRPDQLYGEPEALSPGEIQRRMENQRRRLCLGGYEKRWIQQASGPKALFPDSYEDDWTEDSIDDILSGVVDAAMNTHLSARVVMIEGLGRRVFELQINIDQTAKRKIFSA